MRIIFIGNCYYPHIIGGAELTMQNIAESIRNVGHDVSVITLNPDNVDVSDAVNEVPVYRLKTRNIYHPFVSANRKNVAKKVIFHSVDSYNLFAAKYVDKIIEQNNPDVVFTHNLCGFSVAVWKAIAKRGIPIVHVLHDYYLMCPPSTRYKNRAVCQTQCGACSVFSIPRKIASQYVNVVIGVSDYVLKAHLDSGYFCNASSHVVFNSRPYFTDTPIPRPQNSPLRLGFLGRVSPEKGIETLLAALALLPDLNLSLVVAGRFEDDYKIKLERKFPDSRVIYAGFSRAPSIYTAIDALVVPSEWEEPLPGVIYEPWQYGVPVIASRIGGIPEMIEHGKTGYLVEPGNPAALAEAIKLFCESLKSGRDFSADCMKERANYLPNNQIVRYLEILKDSLIK